MARFDTELKQAGIACEFHRYDGTDRAFRNFTNPECHHLDAAEDAWNRILRFLGDHLA